MTDIYFSTLFTVELLHQYYSDLVCPDFIITPSRQTTALLNGCKIVWRQNDNRLVTGIQSIVDNSQNPAVIVAVDTLPQSRPLTFFLQSKNPYFLNITNIPPQETSGKLFYFTNRNNNPYNSKFFISEPVAEYDSSKSYAPGDLADSANSTYMALKSSSSQNPVGVADSSHWLALANTNTYVTPNDLLKWIPSVYEWPLGPAQNSVNYAVNGYNSASKDYTAIAVPNTTVNFSGPSATFKLDLSHLPFGKYDLLLNDTHNLIYLNDEINTQPAIIGIIEIYNDTDLPGGYSLFQPNTNNLVSPFFSICFLNRFSIWEYFLSGTAQANITDNTTAGYTFTYTPVNGGKPATITSNMMIPLSQAPLDLSIARQDGSLNFKVPSAQPQQLQEINQSQEIYPCSTIFLNY